MSKPATTIDLAAFKKQLADSLVRNATSAGHRIVAESLTCEMSTGVQIVTAAFHRAEFPTEKEFTAGIDLLFGYLSIADQPSLPAGYYRIRLAIPGYEKRGEVKVSFIDTTGKTVHSLTGKGGPRQLKPGSANDNLASPPVVMKTFCGRKKCFNISRHGFGDWEWGCTDLNGNTINCVDRQP